MTFFLFLFNFDFAQTEIILALEEFLYVGLFNDVKSLFGRSFGTIISQPKKENMTLLIVQSITVISRTDFAEMPLSMSNVDQPPYIQYASNNIHPGPTLITKEN